MNSVDVVGEVFLLSRGLTDVFHPQRPSAHLDLEKTFEVSQCRLTCGSMYGSTYRNKPAVMKEKGFG